MDPLVQIEWIAAGSGALAGSMALTGVIGVALLSIRAATKKELRDFARQDEVAKRLLASNKIVTDNAITTFEQLGGIAATTAVIHTLVNSDLTKAIQDKLDALLVQLALAEQVVSLHRKMGVEPPSEVLGIIEASKERIAATRKDLAQRAKQQSIVDQNPDRDKVTEVPSVT